VDPIEVTPLSFDHVLLPLDGSSFAAAALPTARALADHFDAELVTISVASTQR
jgi:nucleotide-binding universal stress UspA family protein